MLKYAPNISTMFKEVEFIKRFEEAHNYGFKYVEIQDISIDTPDTLRAARTRAEVTCTLVNSSDETGAADPFWQCNFLKNITDMTEYCNALGAKCMHILAGNVSDQVTYEEQLNIYKENLKLAVQTLENHDIVGVIEPICPAVKANYFLSSFDTAVEVIKEVDSEYLKLLLDVYHLHILSGDVKKYLGIYYPYAGHVQISQDPGRVEPFVPGGKIDYDFVLNFLAKEKYSKPIGLEYSPSGSTVDSLNWLKNY